MRIIIVLLLIGIVGISKGQAPSDSVIVNKSVFGYKFFHHDNRINFNQLPAILNENHEAQQLIRKAKTTNTVASIISGVGGFMVGWQLGAALVGGEPNWNMAAVGGGLTLIAIPIGSKSNKQAIQAIGIYNEGLSSSSHRPQLFLGASGNGIGMRLNF